MPIYNYFCQKCNKAEEHLFSIKNRPDFINCQTCQGPAQFTLSPTHFVVNGANAANRYSSDDNFGWLDVSKVPKK